MKIQVTTANASADHVTTTDLLLEVNGMNHARVAFQKTGYDARQTSITHAHRGSGRISCACMTLVQIVRIDASTRKRLYICAHDNGVLDPFPLDDHRRPSFSAGETWTDQACDMTLQRRLHPHNNKRFGSRQGS